LKNKDIKEEEEAAGLSTDCFAGLFCIKKCVLLMEKNKLVL